MSETVTPGQLAYEAYWRVHQRDGLWHLPPAFATLQDVTRQSWEAAAQAVRAAWQAQERLETRGG